MHAAQTLDLYKKVELPLVKVLTAMECEGINLDVPFLEELSKNLNISNISAKMDLLNIKSLNNQFQVNFGWAICSANNVLHKKMLKILKPVSS